MTLVPRTPRSSWYMLAASLLVCLGVWRWAETILIPSNTRAAQSKKIPIGNNSDLYPRWLGTRELLLHGRDPYGAEMTSEMQRGFYGRQLDPRNPTDPKDQVAFAYPLYVTFLLAPTVTLQFPVVQTIFQCLLILSLALSVPLWMSAVGFRTRPALTGAGMLLAVGSYPAISDYHLQNLAGLVILMLAASAAAAARGWLRLAGLLLALSTIKPQLSILFIAFFVLWATGHWEQRQRLCWSFAASLLTLIVAGQKVSPGWIGKFLAAIRAYESYAADPSILKVLLPTWLANLIAGALVGLLTFYSWRWKKAPSGSEQFGWAIALVASVTLVVMPKLAAYNQPLLVPALMILLANREAIWRARILPRALTKGVAVCLVWQWGTAVILAFGSLVFPPAQLQAVAGVPEYTLLALPPMTLLAVFASVGGCARSS